MEGGDSRIPKPLSAFDDVAGEAAVVHEVDTVGAVRRPILG